MASKTFTSIALFLAVNLIFFNLTAAQTCPAGSIQVDACVNVLNVVTLTLGNRSLLQPCCSLITGVPLPLDAALCVCQAVKTSILGIVNADVSVGLVYQLCNLSLPSGFNCA